ncbi:MAG: ribonuclease P protein component [Lachnospiraceae bacterium]|nr:ribonuclease P protein component [Lachnospiraceae bacterium]
MFIHIKKNSDFQRVYKNGKSLANRYLVMYVMNNNSNENRVGISVSKKVGNSVTRHRITRLIRESFRLNDNLFENGYDIVIIARVSAKGKSFEEICSAIIHLGKIHNIVSD